MKTHYRDLVKEIEKKHRRAIHKPETCLTVRRLRGIAIEDDAKLNRTDVEAIIDSARIEHPLAHISMLGLGKKEQRDYREELRRLTKHLQHAQALACEFYNPEDGLSQELLLEIAMAIEPEKVHSYRTVPGRDEVTIRSHYPPTAPEHVQEEVAEFLYENKDIHSGLEMAVHAHLHIARIHPFMDANGRTARLVQNTMLASSRYPPITIKEGERAVYYDLLDDAIVGYVDRRRLTNGARRLSQEEEVFFEFLATKINMVYDRILHPNPRYTSNGKRKK